MLSLLLNQSHVPKQYEFPPCSPDVSDRALVERWGGMVRRRVNVSNNFILFNQFFLQQCNNILQRIINNLIGTMVRKLRAASAAWDGHLCYWFWSGKQVKTQITHVATFPILSVAKTYHSPEQTSDIFNTGKTAISGYHH